MQARLLISHVLVTSGMMSCVFSADSMAKRKQEFFGLCVKGGILGLAITAVEQLLLFLQRDLTLTLNKNLSNGLVRSFMENHTFYELIQMGKVSDPGQVIAQDVRDLSTRVTNFLPLFRPIVEIVWFSSHIFGLVGHTASAMFAAYLIGGAAVIRLFMPNFTKIVARESQLEGEYNLVHYRTHNHAESIAFFGGDECEKEVVQTRFKKLMNVIWLRLKTNWYFGLVNQAIVREAPMLVQFLLRNSYGQQWGSDEELTKDAGRALNHAQLFLFNATNTIFDGLGQLLGAAEMVAQLCGVAERVFEVQDALKETKKEDRSQDVAAATVVEQGTLGLNNATIVTPKNKTLVRDLTVKITPETPLLVTGPNGSGKTFFVRCLSRMWPLSDETKGEVVIPQEEKEENKRNVLVVPQAVYMVDGNLFDQLTYPLHISPSLRTEEMKEKMKPLLELVGIPYLLERHGWDQEKKWEDILSLGEQQRMGMARLFYHSPKFGVLDECTSAVSVDVEERLYRHAREMGITCVTISQRLALQEFHTQELRLGELTENKWSLHSTKQE
uniref:ABC transporter domain-containing protein n=1 Tax=Paramoeba aestuarina TaxID=180227 RepID=A0A7S4KUP4_9EUKA|mmetsp:Transcript_25764/g.40207  ORF Transcript_25764/g.40207 Transcript_25764/m.40207 type:complete len:555 (+) Transcript_25764:2-1666(+)